MENNTSPQIIKPLQTSNKMQFIIGGAILIILVGLSVGFVISSRRAINSSKVNIPAITASQTEAGLTDISNIKDITTATGKLQVGGIKGEGTYHLDRPGGVDKTVYLTSTSVDMSTFVGKNVQVWGQTVAGQHAGWLMDVLKLKVVQ